MSFVALVYFESKKYPFETKIYNFLTFMLINLIPYQLDDSTNENTYQKKKNFPNNWLLRISIDMQNEMLYDFDCPS